MEDALQTLIGKTIKSIKKPKTILIGDNTYYDDCYLITFTDGVILKLASWDEEMYSSGIDTEIETDLTLKK